VKCPFHYPQTGSRARKPERPILFCHPELAKDLTAGQPALCHHSPFSKLTAPPDEPSVPSTCRLKRTSRSPREIPSTDSGQALRRLPMNLPERRGVRERESGEHTRLACWRRRPADADFQSPKCIAATPRAKFAEAGRLDQHPGRVRSPELAFRRDQPRRCLWRGRQRPHARARALPGSWRDAGSRPTINAALWLPESLGMTKTMRAALVSVPGLGFVSAALCSCSPRLCRGRWRVPGTSSGRHPRTRRR